MVLALNQLINKYSDTYRPFFQLFRKNKIPSFPNKIRLRLCLRMRHLCLPNKIHAIGKIGADLNYHYVETHALFLSTFNRNVHRVFAEKHVDESRLVQEIIQIGCRAWTF